MPAQPLRPARMQAQAASTPSPTLTGVRHPSWRQDPVGVAKTDLPLQYLQWATAQGPFVRPNSRTCKRTRPERQPQEPPLLCQDRQRKHSFLRRAPSPVRIPVDRYLPAASLPAIKRGVSGVCRHSRSPPARSLLPRVSLHRIQASAQEEAGEDTRISSSRLPRRTSSRY